MTHLLAVTEMFLGLLLAVIITWMGVDRVGADLMALSWIACLIGYQWTVGIAQDA